MVLHTPTTTTTKIIRTVHQMVLWWTKIATFSLSCHPFPLSKEHLCTVPVVSLERWSTITNRSWPRILGMVKQLCWTGSASVHITSPLCQFHHSWLLFNEISPKNRNIWSLSISLFTLHLCYQCNNDWHICMIPKCSAISTTVENHFRADWTRNEMVKQTKPLETRLLILIWHHSKTIIWDLYF